MSGVFTVEEVGELVPAAFHVGDVEVGAEVTFIQGNSGHVHLLLSSDHFYWSHADEKQMKSEAMILKYIITQVCN